MSYKNDNLFDEGLQAVFDNRELKTETLVISLSNAKKASVKRKDDSKSVERKTVIEIVDLKMIGSKMAAVVLSGVIVVAAVHNTGLVIESGAEMVKNIGSSISSVFNNDLSMSKLSKEIGALTDSKLEENGYAQSILSQNTVHTGESNIFYYKHENIAKDLLSLDNRLFDYAFYTVCEDMQPYINNQVGPGGMSNIDSVIFYLKQYSSDKDSNSKAYVSEVLDGVMSLNDYLTKFGYVDKEGKPSLSEFRKVCNDNAELIASILHNGPSEGAKLS